jgi:ATP/maltotriose-dependent transcriptional regulator MalT
MDIRRSWPDQEPRPMSNQKLLSAEHVTIVANRGLDSAWANDAGDVLLRTIDELTEREREVLRYVPSVLSAAEIGEELHISVNTVKAHLRSIYCKFGVSRRRDAAIQAHRFGLL